MGDVVDVVLRGGKKTNYWVASEEGLVSMAVDFLERFRKVEQRLR